MHTLQEYGTLRIKFVGMSHNCVEYRDSKDMPGLSFQNDQNVQRKILVELPVPKKVQH